MNFNAELEWRLCSKGGGTAVLDFLVLVFMLPLSLPLSLFVPDLAVLLKALSEVDGCSPNTAERESFSIARFKSGPGVFGWLTS